MDGLSWLLTWSWRAQGDIGFANVLEQMGAHVEMTPHSVTVTGAPVDPATGRRLRGIDIDMNAMPDVAMTLAVLGLFTDGPVAIRNGERPCGLASTARHRGFLGRALSDAALFA